jgi:hypothetical protein
MEELFICLEEATTKRDLENKEGDITERGKSLRN